MAIEAQFACICVLIQRTTLPSYHRTCCNLAGNAGAALVNRWACTCQTFRVAGNTGLGSRTVNLSRWTAFPRICYVGGITTLGAIIGGGAAVLAGGVAREAKVSGPIPVLSFQTAGAV